jgi:hypothetical protein
MDACVSVIAVGNPAETCTVVSGKSGAGGCTVKIPT